jgi:hypothetical protein
MKIAVMRESGASEVITLTEPIEIRRGEFMNCLKTSTGFEHFFLPDGTYDGWGMPFDGTQDEAAAVIEAIEKDREATFRPEEKE